jgi:hypothetical protein
LACAVEDAGFEVRDSIAWMYGSGFPKSLDVSKAIDKAAGAEREVLSETFHRSQSSSGGILNRVEVPRIIRETEPATDAARTWQGWGTALKPAFEPVVVARKPLVGTVAANVLAHGTGALNVDGCRVGMSDGDRARIGASRFFYTAKADATERVRIDGTAHPTVKPLALMRWLVRLVTPPGGTVLEPFAGSGTTVEACILEGFRCIAIEREADYLPLIRQRINRRMPDTREQAKANLAALLLHARRCQCIIHRLEDDELTEWDQAHRRIDELLDVVVGA